MSNESLIFQILDLDQFHTEDDEGKKNFCIRIFGRTKDDKTIYLQVEGYQPHFYVKIDDTMKQSHIFQLLESPIADRIIKR